MQAADRLRLCWFLSLYARTTRPPGSCCRTRGTASPNNTFMSWVHVATQLPNFLPLLILIYLDHMDSLSPTLSAHDKSAEAAAMEDQKEDQQSHEEGDDLEAAEKGHCGPVSTSGFITAPNTQAGDKPPQKNGHHVLQAARVVNQFVWARQLPSGAKLLLGGSGAECEVDHGAQHWEDRGPYTVGSALLRRVLPVVDLRGHADHYLGSHHESGLLSCMGWRLAVQRAVSSYGGSHAVHQ
ncbi:hypothetical protein PG991_004791 [Apiospora marii]|uniref:Uncharacterized protein n=1 Tax=Apiospora marii TaxID=335849 RepID=A0ABR1S8M7_9PEZI